MDNQLRQPEVIILRQNAGWDEQKKDGQGEED
jgi:hypothetical protein